jgi:FAS-associated factor 2
MQLITTSIIPRTSAFLSRVRRERSTLEESRHLRAEQDRAFREAEARDREKSQRLKEQQRQAKLAAEKEEQARQARASALENRKAWRRYARKHLLPPSAGPIRVALRVPASSERNIRNFYPGPSALPLFIYAETLLIPADEAPESDPDSPPSGYTPPYDFRIVTNYPRKEIGMMEDGGEAVWDTVKQAGGALFAEKKEDGTWGEAESGESDDEADED